MFKYLRYVIFKISLYLFGIKFFKTDMIPTTVEFKKAELETFGSHEIKFLFFRETLEDITFKRGRLKKEEFRCYVIQARFDDDLPDIIKQFNNLKVVFNINSVLLYDEEYLCRSLLNVYLDFINHEVVLEQKKK